MNRADHYAYHEAELALRRVAQRAAEPHAAFFREVAELVREREAFHEQSDSTGRAIVAPIAPVDGTQNREPTAEVVTPSDAVGTAIDKAERELHGYTAPLSQERETAAKFLAMARDLLHRYGKDAAQQKLDAAMAVLGMEKP